MKIHRRAAAVALVCFAGALAAKATAQTPSPPKIAVLSLIGDSITIDEYVGQTGTNLDGLSRETVPIGNPVFDNTALLAAQDALKKLSPAAQVATLAPPKAGSSSDPVKLLVDGKVDAANSLVAALRKEGYGQLLVISKHRAPAQLKLRSVTVGHGHISGLGFYVDRKYEIEKIATGEVAKGFIAPYAYMKISLVDMESLAVVRESEITLGQVEADFNLRAGISPWDALTPEQKTRILRNLVTSGVARAMPAVMTQK